MIIENLVAEMKRRGYDVFDNNGNLIILENSFVSTTPLKNIIKLLTDKLLPLSINDMIPILISNHNTKKDIDNGKYKNSPAMSNEEISKKMNEIFRKNIF